MRKLEAVLDQTTNRDANELTTTTDAGDASSPRPDGGNSLIVPNSSGAPQAKVSAVRAKKQGVSGQSGQVNDTINEELKYFPKDQTWVNNFVID